MNEAQLLGKLRSAFGFAERQVERLISKHPEYFPMYTQAGKWKHGGEAWTNWCEGFLGGQMWIFHHRTGSQAWRRHAEHYSRLLEHRQTDQQVHDLGFLFWPTYKRWYDLSGDERLQQVIVTAGQTMGLRFKDHGRYLRSFVADGSLFIDIMMNVGIVFYAALQTGDQLLLDKATRHCLTTRRTLVRGDGGTAHEGLFDTVTGRFLRQSTHQGWRDDSTWARGQAWALYGFGTAYQMCADRRFLQASQLCAEYYLDHTDFGPEARFGPGVPPNDWDEPSETTLVESSAAAIAAGGLLNLAAIVQDPAHAERYRRASLTILDTLCTRYLGADDPEWEGILKGGIYHRRKQLGVNESVMWGDYFFVEAADKAMTLMEAAHGRK